MEENKKTRIMNCALELFSKNGFDAVSIRDICKYANVNVSMVSYYFGGKEELYNALVEELFCVQKNLFKEYFALKIETLNREEKIGVLSKFLNILCDYVYNNASKSLVGFLLRVQQDPKIDIEVPIFIFLLNLLSSILNKNPKDQELVYKVIFLMSQVSFPKIVPLFSLKTTGRSEFDQSDLIIIKDNLKKYIEFMFEEEGTQNENI